MSEIDGTMQRSGRRRWQTLSRSLDAGEDIGRRWGVFIDGEPMVDIWGRLRRRDGWTWLSDDPTDRAIAGVGHSRRLRPVDDHLPQAHGERGSPMCKAVYPVGVFHDRLLWEALEPEAFT